MDPLLLVVFVLMQATAPSIQAPSDRINTWKDAKQTEIRINLGRIGENSSSGLDELELSCALDGPARKVRATDKVKAMFTQVTDTPSRPEDLQIYLQARRDKVRCGVPQIDNTDSREARFYNAYGLPDTRKVLVEAFHVEVTLAQLESIAGRADVEGEVGKQSFKLTVEQHRLLNGYVNYLKKDMAADARKSGGKDPGGQELRAVVAHEWGEARASIVADLQGTASEGTRRAVVRDLDAAANRLCKQHKITRQKLREWVGDPLRIESVPISSTK